MPRQSSFPQPGSPSIDDADLTRTLREAAESLREYVQAIRHRPDQLPPIAFAMAAEAAFIGGFDDDLERR